MDETTIREDAGLILDVLGQQVLPIYTQICFCFPVVDPSSYPLLIETLEAGLEKLFLAFPWLEGCVINEGATSGNTGVFMIKTSGKKNRLIVKDMRNDPSFPAMGVLQRTGFPIGTLDESVVAPRKTRISNMNQLVPPEVLLLQANIINGGLILTFLGHHQAMDGIGQDHVIRLFSKACRDEHFTAEERSVGNLDKRNTIPLLDMSREFSSKLDHQNINLQRSPSLPHARSLPRCAWAYFSFSRVSLEALKLVATRALSSGFVSTDDALSAFIWKSVTSVRLARLSATTSSTFARAVDVRRPLNISAMHPGFVQNMTYNTFTFRQLANMSLGAIALELRSKVDPRTSDVAYDTRALGTLIARLSDKTCISFAAALNPTSDIFFSSWAKMKSYDYDFGLGLGSAEAVRRTRSHASEGLMYLMPRTQNGEIGLVMCLGEEDMERLTTDDQFLEFATYVG
jgi:hypothetical protein